MGHDPTACFILISPVPHSYDRLQKLGIAYLSLNPPAAAADFPLTEMTASSNPHDEAAEAIPAPTSREGRRELRNRIVVVVLWL